MDVRLQFGSAPWGPDVIKPKSDGHAMDSSGAPALPKEMVSSADASTLLAQQLQHARASLDDDDYGGLPRAPSLMPQRLTVYLPHEEGALVQLSVIPPCSAHQLVIQVLDHVRTEWKESQETKKEKEKDGPAAEDEDSLGDSSRLSLSDGMHSWMRAGCSDDLPPGLLDDPYSYRVHVAEEDGEVDTDFPVLGLRADVCTLGVDTFVLRDRVDARRIRGGTSGGGYSSNDDDDEVSRRRRGTDAATTNNHDHGHAASSPHSHRLHRASASGLDHDGTGEDHSATGRKRTVGPGGIGSGGCGGFKTLEMEGEDSIKAQKEDGQCCAGMCSIQ